MLPKIPFDGPNPKLTRNHWAVFEKCKGFQEMQHNMNQSKEFKKMFAFKMSVYARAWRSLKDAFLKAFNYLGQTLKE